MKQFYQTLAVISLIALLFSCTRQPDIDVKVVGELRARRTFANIQFMDDEKEKNRYVAEQEASNPRLYDNFSTADSLLAREFERVGLVKNNEFLQQAFKPLTKPITTFTDRYQQVFRLEFYNDSISGHVHFKLSSSKTTVNIDTEADPLQNLDYLFLDIIPGGNKELVFLDDYYIMNGFNFHLKVYEIKTGGLY